MLDFMFPNQYMCNQHATMANIANNKVKISAFHWPV